MTVLRYKGYEGSAEVDLQRGVCHGRIRLIDDLVTYEAATPRELVGAFEAAVDDYLETCRQLNRAPRKSYGGVFNVRTSPEKHCELGTRALRKGASLNAIVNEAIDMYLERSGSPASSRTRLGDTSLEMKQSPAAGAGRGSKPSAGKPGMRPARK
nr:type II toxin-antitoxin system HicB family antitoxin [Ramlibacter sp. Leaf400]